ncbi:Hypothetical predicted protein [Olea europaea subsp. europaea]|uniref:Uncharacterized protein n=1 Tax=Olea europaea subsp. europaea TaxID=158383 RepID=A0A8S0UN49_OLEEU|nr:Hypothetical predicted protein [Olea europaea subsp. europaea]
MRNNGTKRLRCGAATAARSRIRSGSGQWECPPVSRLRRQERARSGAAQAFRRGNLLAFATSRAKIQSRSAEFADCKPARRRRVCVCESRSLRSRLRADRSLGVGVGEAREATARLAGFAPDRRRTLSTARYTSTSQRRERKFEGQKVRRGRELPNTRPREIVFSCRGSRFAIRGSRTREGDKFYDARFRVGGRTLFNSWRGAHSARHSLLRASGGACPYRQLGSHPRGFSSHPVSVPSSATSVAGSTGGGRDLPPALEAPPRGSQAPIDGRYAPVYAKNCLGGDDAPVGREREPTRAGCSSRLRNRDRPAHTNMRFLETETETGDFATRRPPRRASARNQLRSTPSRTPGLHLATSDASSAPALPNPSAVASISRHDAPACRRADFEPTNIVTNIGGTKGADHPKSPRRRRRRNRRVLAPDRRARALIARDRWPCREPSRRLIK